MNLVSPIDDLKSQKRGTGWNLLGEAELSLNMTAEAVLKTWLEELLAPLRLHADIRGKILTSSLDSVLRARQLDAQLRPRHMHVSVLISDGQDPNGTMWGFFRIEKIDNPEVKKPHPDHAIEFYLYREGV